MHEKAYPYQMISIPISAEKYIIVGWLTTTLNCCNNISLNIFVNIGYKTVYSVLYGGVWQ
jgi:hypothetical protein